MGDARGGAACAAAAYDDAPRVHDAGRRDGISPENRSQQKSPKRCFVDEKGATEVVGVESEGCTKQLLLSKMFFIDSLTKMKVDKFRAAVDGL